MPPFPYLHLHAPSPQENAAQKINDALRSLGPGGTVLLAQRSTWHLTEPIYFSSDDQEIATWGYPAFRPHRRLPYRTRHGPDEEDVPFARLVTSGGDSCAINAVGRNRIRIRNVRIEGRRGEHGYIRGGAALVLMGGQASDQLIDSTRLLTPRSWSCLHVFEGPPHARNVRTRVTNNFIGPAGRPAHPAHDDAAGEGGGAWRKEDDEGTWADGISLAGRDAIVTGNTVIDATDGGIVVFGAPGSLVAGNTIVSQRACMLGGINMVDVGPYSGDYSFARVESNTVCARGKEGYIKIGIAIGPATWGDDLTSVVRDGRVVGNSLHCEPSRDDDGDWEWRNENDEAKNYFERFSTGAFGYGIAVSGAHRFSILHNLVHPSARFIGVVGGLPPVPFSTAPHHRHDAASSNVLPAALVRARDATGERWRECEMQCDFVEGNVRHLINVRPGVPEWTRWAAGALRMGEKESVETDAVRLEVRSEAVRGDGGQAAAWAKLVVVEKRSGKLVFEARSCRSAKGSVRLDFDDRGRLRLLDDECGQRHRPPLWDATAHLDGSAILSQPRGPHVLTLRSSPPHLLLETADGDVLWASSYEVPLSMEMMPGRWIALPVPSRRPADVEAGAAVSVEAVFHELTPELVYRVKRVRRPEEDGEVLWNSPNARLDDGDRLGFMAFQGDGNLVIYGPSGPLWATGTNGRGGGPNEVAKLVLGHERGRAVTLVDGKGEIVWQV